MSESLYQNEITGLSSVSKIGLLSLLNVSNRFSFSLTMVVLPLYALAIGQDEAFYGLMVATAGYVQSIVIYPGGMISDRKGRGVSIFIGSMVAGCALIALPFATDVMMILALYALTGVGGGFVRTSIDSLVADYTQRGQERTKSYGYTIAIATLAGTVGPFLGGFILDPSALPGINEVMLRFAIVFAIMGGARIATGFLGVYTERKLKNHHSLFNSKPPSKTLESDNSAENDRITAFLFGFSQLIMGFSSGMVIPYLIPWINAAFAPDPVILGTVPAIASLTLASGTLIVGLSSERVGKLRMILFLYFLAPILTLGLVYSPFFLMMAAFYIARMAVANMSTPAINSLLTGEIHPSRRARSISITRIMWTFPRQTGVLATSFILGAGLFGGMVSFGITFFPIAMMLYPVSVIPMYIAVRRNRLRGISYEASS